MENDMSETITKHITIDIETAPQKRAQQNVPRAKWMLITLIPWLVIAGVLFFGIISQECGHEPQSREC